MRAWEHALRTRVPEGTRIVGLSNLKRLPFFVPKGLRHERDWEQLLEVAEAVHATCLQGRVHLEGFAPRLASQSGVFSPSER